MQILQTNFFSDFKTCESNLNNINQELCTDIVTAYWMIVISVVSSILSFINLFPFFIIKKKITLIDVVFLSKYYYDVISE